MMTWAYRMKLIPNFETIIDLPQLKEIFFENSQIIHENNEIKNC